MSIKNVDAGLTGALLLLSMLGCGKELARVPFATEATGDTSAQLAPGKVDFWTDLDVAYVGKPSISYEIDLEQHGSSVARTVCDPLGPKPSLVSWTEIHRGPYHHLSGQARMSCEVAVPKGGLTTVRVTLAHDATAKDVAITKADLIVKQ